VFLFVQTDDFARDYEAFRANGVRFIREPKQATYGTVAVFEDLCRNLWDGVCGALTNQQSPTQTG
jgi:hypothetical protein